MGTYWLTSLPDVLAEAGVNVGTYDGWEVRARSTGGYDGIWAVQVHHTASSASPESDMSYCWTGSPDRPVGALYLARDGKVTVGAAGATNTSGKGGPRATVHGTIPLDSANKYVISIEAANNGVGEAWPKAQVDAYVQTCAALNVAYGLSVGDTHAHWEWCLPNYPGRKVDPAGQSRYATGASSWNMDAFRGDVFAAQQPAPPPTGDVDMFLVDSTRIIDTRPTHRVGPFGRLQGGTNYSCPRPNLPWLAPVVKGYGLIVTIIDPEDGGGLFQVWSKGAKTKPSGTGVNWVHGETLVNGYPTVACGSAGTGEFNFGANKDCDVTIDIVGFYPG